MGTNFLRRIRRPKKKASAGEDNRSITDLT
jgi:hypothetical protein